MRWITKSVLFISLMMLVIISVSVRGQGLFDLDRIRRATVFIFQTQTIADQVIITCVGTGTVVSRDGLILTNAHHTVPNRVCQGDRVLIALNTDFDEPPVPMFRGTVIQANPGLDLALLRISEHSDGRMIAPGTLSLPFVELGDSNTLALDSTLTLLGYPDLGDSPLIVTRSTVVGFLSEPSSSKSWVKIGTTLPGTATGGGAYDSSGRLVAITTTAPQNPETTRENCVVLQDTSGNNLIDARDRCVPLGDPVTTLRPAAFAQPLLRAALFDLDVTTSVSSVLPVPVSGAPSISRLFFASAVNEAGMPSSVVRTLPTGANGVYLFFNYDNMTAETIYELRVTINGVPAPTFSLSPVRWSSGIRGMWHIGLDGQPLPGGVYDFTLLLDGVPADTARLIVGQSPPSNAAFSDIVFGIEDDQGNVLGNGFVLPTGAIASARFIHRSVARNTPWTAIWYYEGREVYREQQTWQNDENGAKTIRIQDPTGLLPGSYRLELYLQDVGGAFRLASTADFILAGAQEGTFARIFSDLHYATADSDVRALTAPAATSFSAGLERMYVVFNWEQIRPGTLYTVRWLVDGDPFFEQTLPWAGAESGDGFLLRLFSSTGIPDGTYSVELLVSRILFASQSVRVGIGQLPIDRFAEAVGVQFQGRIFDADTGIGISGATFVMITEEFSAADFTRDWLETQVYAIAVTDRSGRFFIDRPLLPGVLYSVHITAQGYLPISADAFAVSDAAGTLDLPIFMTRG